MSKVFECVYRVVVDTEIPSNNVLFTQPGTLPDKNYGDYVTSDMWKRYSAAKFLKSYEGREYGSPAKIKALANRIRKGGSYPYPGSCWQPLPDGEEEFFQWHIEEGLRTIKTKWRRVDTANRLC